MIDIQINKAKIIGLPDQFTYLNNVLYIPKKYHEKTPIKLTLNETVQNLKIEVEENSSVKIILEVASQTLTHQSYQLELVAKQNSQIKYLLVCELESQNDVVTHHFDVHKDARLDLLAGVVGNQLDVRFHIDLLGEGAEVKMRSITVSSADHKQKMDAYITHYAPNTYGDMTNIGIANERGHVTLNGIEKIEKGMKNANAFQTLKGIIASDLSSVDVNPILLIDEYDVKAGHGATIGKLEEEALYYLRSRGLTLKEAEKLIINGLIRPIIDEIDDEALKERFVHLVNLRI